MKIYLSIGGSKKVKAFMRELGLGWCIAPNKVMNPGKFNYILDNGAFHAWNYGEVYIDSAFKILVDKFPNYDFAVAPDIVCGGNRSLNLSLDYVDQIPGPLYLAVQDGMDASMVTKVIDQFDGLFIGGSISWKFQTARMWSDLAHLHGKKCHAGRVNTWEGYVHMHYCGVDSVDGSYASRHHDDKHIRKYLEHLKSQSFLSDFRTSNLAVAVDGMGCDLQ
jgi:hypothetical protein